MALQSTLKKVETFRWDFNEPLDNASIDSPLFVFMDTKWMLKYNLSFYLDDDKYYSINLINCYGTNSFKPFEITTILEHRNNGNQQICSHLTISNPYNTLWVEKRSKTEKKLGFSCLQGQEFSVICVFFPPRSFHTDSVKTTEESTRVIGQRSSSPITTYSLLLDHNQACISAKSSLISLKPLSSLEFLSEDMGGMLSQGLLPDLELKCEEVTIPAHKAILTARCKDFAAMCESEMLNNKTGTVEINYIMPSTLQEYLKFLYSGKLSEKLSVDIVSQLYSFSYQYAVHSLQKECAHLMAINLNDENFIEFFITAEGHGDQMLKGAVADFIAGTPRLMKCNSWIKFSDEFPNLANEIYSKYVEKTLPR